MRIKITGIQNRGNFQKNSHCQEIAMPKGIYGKINFYLIAFFILLILFGINTGETSAVWEKAVSLCLSCMGIG